MSIRHQTSGWFIKVVILKPMTTVLTLSNGFFFLQLVVEISSVSPISLGYCANSSFISQLLGELTGDDVLVR